MDNKKSNNISQKKSETSRSSSVSKSKSCRGAKSISKSKTSYESKSASKVKSSYGAKSVSSAAGISSLFSTGALDNEAKFILENFDQIIQGVRPLNSRQLQQLPDNIRNLSHQLTDQRSTRRLGYMNDNIQLSSYVRYYTWWNLVRLTRLFSNLPASAFPGFSSKNDENNPGTDGENPVICLDLGSGPLTVVTALWLARPELRCRPLVWYCLDVSANSMALGEDIYLSVVARMKNKNSSADENQNGNKNQDDAGEYHFSNKNQDDANDSYEPWKIIRVKGSFGTQIRQKADFITCANMFNELDQASDMPPEFQSKKYYDQISKYSAPYARVLLIEPGVPKAARTLSLLRERFIRDDFAVVAPCPHAGECPMNGFKAYTGSQHKWCNFAFTTEDAPARLQKLSVQAKLPKERATLSFLCVTGDLSLNRKLVAEAKTKAADGGKLVSGSGKLGSDGGKLSSDSGKLSAGTSIACRITSDAFKLPGNKTGFYACSELGLTLVKTKVEPGGREIKSGDFIQVSIKNAAALARDEKSGAVVVEA